MQESNEKTMELALEKAAKMVCNMKSGLCPIREEHFSGCPRKCTEDTRPWQCWFDYFRELTLLPFQS
ncbi:MAG: hypothetical protein D3913_12500 [Candidatus Electrothrix sp. LOE1_4_5]|nr:hypothetical protein [Candidatus Electrothrix sp. AX1]MCI5118743.1 hypothetical protein [Candidatus Electrothrix gigas]MCI5183590.1 hypothetical protein [Candidatus Electrothrix gigas]MCI5192695.1 hypothetical protein [Candidatus Electrothrix gigas]